MEHEFRGYALVLQEGADPRTGGVAIAGAPQQAWLVLSPPLTSLRH